MREFPLYKLKINIHGFDNPTSVFKKKNFLSLNCIHSSKKSKTPLRIFSKEELPHYMLPIKAHKDKDENKKNNKIKKPKIKLDILCRNKSDIELESKKKYNSNKVNNIYNTINFNKNNLNTNVFTSAHLNDYSSSNKDNNENIISELNIITHNINNTSSFEDVSFQSKLSELQKKINEQNILLLNKDKEIEKLKEEINNINKEYQTELNNNKNLEEKYQFLKNNMKNSNKNDEIKKYENKIIEQENKIITLEEKLNDIKNKKLKITKESNFSILIKKESNIIITNNNIENNEYIFDSKHYDDIKLLLCILFNIYCDLNINYILEQINNDEDINDIVDNICSKIKIKNNNIIKNFIKDFILKNINEKNNNVYNDYKELFKKINTKIKISNKIKKTLYENCKKYDYKNKHKIPFYYFKHIYKEICYKNKKNFSSNDMTEFYAILYECKKGPKKNDNTTFSLFDIFYENLYPEKDKKDAIVNKEDNSEFEINKKYQLKYPELVKNFLDKIIKDASDKKNEQGDFDDIKAKSFEQDFFGNNLLEKEKKSKNFNFNNSSDFDDNNYEI